MNRTAVCLAALLFVATPAWADFDAGFAAYSKGDYAAALDEWRTLADAGDARAQVGLGFMHEKGLGVPQDHTKAVRWYRLGSEQGDPIAEYNLAVMYGNGTGVLKDYVKAFALFSLSAEHGNKEAEGSLTYIERLMSPDEMADAKALLDQAGNDPAQAARTVLAGVAPAAPAPAAAETQVEPEVPEIQVAAAPEPAAQPAPPPEIEVAATPIPAVEPEPAPQPVAPPPVVQAAVDPAPVIAPAAEAAYAEPVASPTPQPIPEPPAAPVAKQAPAAPAPAAQPAAAPAPAQAAATPEIRPAGEIAIQPAAAPWRIHMASLRSREAAEVEWQRLKQRHAAALSGTGLIVETVDLPDKGLFYRVLAGPIVDKTKAEQMCAAISGGDQYCRAMR